MATSTTSTATSNTSRSTSNTSRSNSNTSRASVKLSQREKKKRKNQPVQLENEHWSDDLWRTYTPDEIKSNFAKAKKLL